VILALLFGASRVADLGGAPGRGIREFRSEARGEDETADEEPAKTSSDADSAKSDT
jgi:TatA/E family protein of Tat protein translocase